MQTNPSSPPVSFTPPPDPDVDEMVRVMKRTKRAPFVVGLVSVGIIALSVGLYVLGGRAATRSELAGRGYTEISVSSDGLFSYRYTGTKGSSACAGSFQRLPFSSSWSESCFDVTPRPPLREQIERSLQENYAKTGFDSFACPEVPASERSVTCTLAAANGTSVQVSIAATKVAGDGRWTSWRSTPEIRAINGEVLASELWAAVTKGREGQGPNDDLVIACGKGPQLLRDDTIACVASLRGKTPRTGTVTVSFLKEGGYNWKVSGI